MVPTRGVCRRDAGNTNSEPPGATDAARLADFKEAVEGPQKPARADPGTATSSPRSSACTIRRAWASERTSLSVPQTISIRAGDQARRRAVIGAGVIGKGTGHFSKQCHRQLADG